MQNLPKILCIVIFVSLIANLSFADDDRTLIRGERAFAACANCHTIHNGGDHTLGPNLYSVFGREVASVPDFSYSETIQQMSGIWDEDKLNRYIASPKLAASGNEMPFRGILSPHMRADLIAWLKTNPDSYNAKNGSLEALIENANIVRGREIASSCLACHTAGEGMPHKIGPNLWGVMGRDIARAPGFDYSEKLMLREGRWTPEKLNAFLFEVKRFDQGSHMAFLRLGKLEDRAAIIHWLDSLSNQNETNADFNQ